MCLINIGSVLQVHVRGSISSSSACRHCSTTLQSHAPRIGRFSIPRTAVLGSSGPVGTITSRDQQSGCGYYSHPATSTACLHTATALTADDGRPPQAILALAAFADLRRWHASEAWVALTDAETLVGIIECSLLCPLFM